jgi:anti-anti-sigma regulatory factor
MSKFKHFEIRVHGDVTELHLADTSLYDVPQYTELQHELMDYVELSKPAGLILSFDLISYASTALINGVLKAQNRLKSLGGKLKLFGLSESVREAFRMLKLDEKVVSIYDREEDALAAF